MERQHRGSSRLHVGEKLNTEADQKFHRHVVKKIAEYIFTEYGDGIANYAQAQRVKKHALRAIKGNKLRDLRDYIRDCL